jgi:CHAP domain
MRDLVLKIASAEVGYKETPAGSNKTKFGEWYGTNGVAWCAIFCSWLYAEAGVVWPKLLETKKGFAWVPTLMIRARQYGWITIDPQPADLVVYDWNADAKPDHVAVFVKWIVKGKTFEAIEGNTSKGNDSNGGEVMWRKDRNVKQVAAFITVIK